MPNIKHVGRIKNTNRKCVVVFREIYDERGNVVDGDHCLVFETESLPDAEHQDLMRIIEGASAQSTGDVYNILNRERLGTGEIALRWLVRSGRLAKHATNNVVLTPDSSTQIGLNVINKIVKMQRTGASEAAINRVIQDDTDLPPRQASVTAQELSEASESTALTEDSQSGDVLDDATIAKDRITQAELFEKQAAELRKQAYDLDPSLKPKSTRKKSTT